MPARQCLYRLVLTLSAASRALETARVLLDHGADVDALDGQGRTALHRAATAGELAMVRLLLAAGASVAPDAEGNSPLVAAHRHHAVVRELWRAGAPPDGVRSSVAAIIDPVIADEVQRQALLRAAALSDEEWAAAPPSAGGSAAMGTC